MSEDKRACLSSEVNGPLTNSRRKAATCSSTHKESTAFATPPDHDVPHLVGFMATTQTNPCLLLRVALAYTHAMEGELRLGPRQKIESSTRVVWGSVRVA